MYAFIIYIATIWSFFCIKVPKHSPYDNDPCSGTAFFSQQCAIKKGDYRGNRLLYKAFIDYYSATTSKGISTETSLCNLMIAL